MTLALTAKLQTKAGVLAVGGVALVTAAAGTAYAAWAVSGSGAVSKAASTISSLSVSGTIGGDLYPGSLNAVSVTVGNPNVFPVSVTGVSFGAVSSDKAGCDATNVVLTAPGTVAIAVPAGGSVTTSLGNLASMLLAAPTECAGATFSLTASVTGVST